MSRKPRHAKEATAEATGKILLFYGHSQGKPYREFSNFYWHDRPYEFQLPSYARREGFSTSVWCEFSEKAIMATKAALMGDEEIFKEIEKSTDPGACKKLGRGVRNFNEDLWLERLEDIAFEVVKQKFCSSKALKELLLKTGDVRIAEAAPGDCIWGIGMGCSDPHAQDPTMWKGRNVLGEALMKARDHIRGNKPSSCSGADADISPSAVGDEEKATLAGSKRRWGKSTAAQHEAAPQPSGSANCTVAASQKAKDAETASCAEPEKLEMQAGPAVINRHAFDVFAVLDFEATCIKDGTLKPQEVIEFPIVLVDATSGESISEFRTYVKPVHHPVLSEFCTELTGITQDCVEEAPEWVEALSQASCWLDEQLARLSSKRCIFVTCGEWDLRSMMRAQCRTSKIDIPDRFKQWISVKALYQAVTGKEKHGMAHMLEVMQLSLDGRHHSGLDDSRNTAKLLGALLAEERLTVDEDFVSTSKGTPSDALLGEKHKQIAAAEK
eukprot:CAMPEP_0178416156 /NCGR_PEP_ID=MMETSP0689_2-20121128/23918_1 /TAXON_ID=160604 /ORGANISM="Amphidinium massartii, Strain CS-259" /LENGTH=497 /DNA_ID=CAMNT_0020037491 /DNA_START=23 /DNA_END=1516 /DNA_ORIENTATION=-